jgi:hypothetical protein
VLGKTLTWLITSSIADVYVPVEVKDQVLSDWAHVCGGDLDVDGIDVKKVILYRNLQWWYYGAIMEQYLSTQLGRWRVKEVVARGIVELECKVHATFRNQQTGMELCLVVLRQENMELKSAINGSKMSMDRNFGIVNGNLHRLAMRPTTNSAVLAVAVTNQGGVASPQKQRAAAGGDRAMMHATLMQTPRSLHDLWQEYEHSVGERKAARLFPILNTVTPSTSISERKFCGIDWLPCRTRAHS